MAKNTGIRKTCKKGHVFFKSSDCPTCPICESERAPTESFMALISAPARRALESIGATTLKKLAKYSEKDLLKLHGFGPASIPILKKSLKEEGLSFKS